jgi:AraC-like DNA-binding protein
MGSVYQNKWWRRLLLFIKNKSSMYVLGSALLLQAAFYCLFLYQKDIHLYPAQDFDFFVYNDSANGGHSLITGTHVHPDFLEINLILKEGFINPFAGIRFSPKTNLLDLSRYNLLQTELSGTNIKYLTLFILTEEPKVKNPTHTLALRHSTTGIPLTEEKKVQRLPFRQFMTPDWWYESMEQLPPEFDMPDFALFKGLNITTGVNTELYKTHSIRIHHLRFCKDNTAALLLMLGIQGILTVALFAVWLYKEKQKATQTLTVNYKAVFVPQAQNKSQVFFEYIHENFSDPDLSLTQVAKAAGIHSRSIAETIAQKYNCNFKTYINRIRIQEAQRLLKETNLHIGEIAYKVGFNSPNNFNRVFKNMTGKNPSEYIREQ